MTEITIMDTIRQSLPIKSGDILEQIKKQYSIPEVLNVEKSPRKSSIIDSIKS